jgi:hypothetical protein
MRTPKPDTKSKYLTYFRTHGSPRNYHIDVSAHVRIMIGHQYASDPELHLRDELLFKTHCQNVNYNALDTNRNIQSSTIL